MLDSLRAAPPALFASLTLALTLLGGCDPEAPSGERCVTGASASCACPDGTGGAQVCGDDGRFGPCVCVDGGSGADAGPGEDAGPTPTCMGMCRHVYEECGRSFSDTSGASVDQATCVRFCDEGSFSADEVACFQSAPCTDEALDACFGAGGPVCPRDRDCEGRLCGADPVCATSCGSCAGDSACGDDRVCANARGWRFLPIANGFFDSPDLAFDASGDLHLVWQRGNDIEYARHTDGDFTTPALIETVGRELISLRISLAVDAEGRPHVAYYDPSGDRLRYAHRRATGWQRETVADGGVGTYASLAVDGDGNPHVAFQDGSANALGYARREGGSWQVEIVDDAASAGRYTAIAIDGDGRPHIAYGVGISRVAYARHDGEEWVIETVASGGTPNFVSLALAGDVPHVVFSARDDRRTRHASPDGEGGWHVTDLGDSGNGNAWTSAVAGDDGVVHMAWRETSLGELRYARLEGDDFIHEVADNASSAGNENRIALSPTTGEPWILHLTTRPGENLLLTYKR